jgi:hypothetical protein
MAGPTPWKAIKNRMRERRASKIPLRADPRYAVHAFGRQMWCGNDEARADIIIEEYESLGIKARKINA